jgi:hypothetical protein
MATVCHFFCKTLQCIILETYHKDGVDRLHFAPEQNLQFHHPEDDTAI